MTALVPQFVGQGPVSAFEFALVSSVFLTIVFLGDLLWVAFANSAGRALVRYSNLRNRLTGAFLAAVGIGVAVSRRWAATFLRLAASNKHLLLGDDS